MSPSRVSFFRRLIRKLLEEKVDDVIYATFSATIVTASFSGSYKKLRLPIVCRCAVNDKFYFKDNTLVIDEDNDRRIAGTTGVPVDLHPYTCGRSQKRGRVLPFLYLDEQRDPVTESTLGEPIIPTGNRMLGFLKTQRLV